VVTAITAGPFCPGADCLTLVLAPAGSSSVLSPAAHSEGAPPVKQELESLVSQMVEKGILFEDARREFEKRFIARVLQRHRGNLSKAAKDLRIHRNTLGKKIDQYKL
jgi:Fis family transcriptional regulator, factor for inversion stimulation protein